MAVGVLDPMHYWDKPCIMQPRHACKLTCRIEMAFAFTVIYSYIIIASFVLSLNHPTHVMQLSVTVKHNNNNNTSIRSLVVCSSINWHNAAYTELSASNQAISPTK